MLFPVRLFSLGLLANNASSFSEIAVVISPSVKSAGRYFVFGAVAVDVIHPVASCNKSNEDEETSIRVSIVRIPVFIEVGVLLWEA